MNRLAYMFCISITYLPLLIYKGAVRPSLNTGKSDSK